MMFLDPPGCVLEYWLMEVVECVVCVPSVDEDTVVKVHQGEGCVCPGSQARSGMGVSIWTRFQSAVSQLQMHPCLP